MSLRSSTLAQRIDSLRAAGATSTLRDIRVGLEREALRVNEQAHLSNRSHPSELGSALTHPYITTDYSEALIELITPPGDLEATYQFLTDLHHYTYAHLDQEYLWCGSMPCVIAGDPDIPLAYYGESNAGRMKTIYRRGLGYRYTRSMQVIAGVHFNCSMPKAFWDCELGDQPSQADISKRYLGVVRNFMRCSWLTAYLFGASPAICRRFVLQHPSHYQLETFTPGTFYRPDATSLRLGGIGYQNNVETRTGVRPEYNDLSKYLESLHRATSTPCSEYERIGVKRDGKYLQLNANQLQIEDEFYSTVRPKCVPQKDERPIRALRLRGIEYVELRSLDINPYDPCGISLEALRFLMALVVYCLLEDSPPMSQHEQDIANSNMLQVAHNGRNSDTVVRCGNDTVSVRECAQALLAEMQPVCAWLDEAYGRDDFQKAWQEQHQKIQEPEQTLSGRMVTEMREQGSAYAEWVVVRSRAHREKYLQQAPNAALHTHLDQLGQHSHAQQQALEAEESQHPNLFDDYLAAYQAQT